jgi:hypothetical protein
MTEVLTKKEEEIIEHLRKVRFIGLFPEGVDVLLVKVTNALDEAKFVDREFTNKQLLVLFKKAGIFVFRDVEDYSRWRKDLKSK